MDVNLALLGGRLALPPYVELQPDGSRRAHLLVYVRSEWRKRCDVVPVVVPEEVGSAALEGLRRGTPIHVAGPLMRRCSHDPWEPSGRIEVIANSIRLPDVEETHRPR
jgi:hypothetical protein